MARRVLIMMESSLEISRQIIDGILGYVRSHEPWTIDITPGGIGDQRLSDGWSGDGIIARIPSRCEADHIAAHPAHKIIFDPSQPFVCNHPLSSCSRIECDHLKVGRLAAEYFISRGLRHFAYIPPTISSSTQMHYDGTGLAEPNWSVLRREGFTAQLAKAGFRPNIAPCPRTLAKSSNWCAERADIIKFLKSLPKPLAVFTPNDARGRQVADACSSADIKVPYQAAILGVNNDKTLCETAIPPLSSISLDAKTAGHKAAQELDRLMSGHHSPQQPILYAPQKIITRDSSLLLQTDDALVISILEKIRKAKGFNIRVGELATFANVSLHTLEDRFKRSVGRSVGDILRETCLNSIGELVKMTDIPFTEIAAMAGHLSPAHLAFAFRRHFGMTMSEWRKSD